MEITDVQIIKMEGKGKLLAYANIVLNEAIVLKEIIEWFLLVGVILE